MLGFLFIYFIGKRFYTLAEVKYKKKWLFAVLGVVSYYLGQFIGGFVLGIIFELFSPQTLANMSDFQLSLICIPFGLVACFGFYWILKQAWRGDEKIKPESFAIEKD